MANKPPRVVAELGRPETPDETAARKAENTRKHRANQTFINLLLALGASLGVVLILVLIVVRPDQPPTKAIDYKAAASQSQSGITTRLAAPTLPPGWNANNAQLNPVASDGHAWSVGFITPQVQYVALEQGIRVPSGWAAGFLGKVPSTGTTTIGGIEWQVFDRRTAKDPGNFAYALETTIADSVYLIHGTAAEDEFMTFTESLAVDIAPAGR